MLTKCWSYLLPLILVAVACKKEKGVGQQKTGVTADSLRKIIRALQENSEMPGLYVAVIKKGQVTFSQGYGYADQEQLKPFTAKTIMPVASVSKTLAGIAVMKAIENGLLTMETNINEVLPFKVVNPNFPLEPIKVKHLVTHTAALVDQQELEEDVNEGKLPRYSLGEFLKAYFLPGGQFYLKENFAPRKPGVQVEYSNFGTCLLAYLVEVKTGISYDKYVQQQVFNPLQLRSAHWHYEDARSPWYADLHMPQPANIWYPRVFSWSSYPDGSWRVSGEDLTSYLVEMIKGYEGTGTLLSKVSYQEMFTGKVAQSGWKIGAFWFTSDLGYLGHGGNDPGIATDLWFDPVTKSGWLMMTNTSINQGKTPKLFADYRAIEKSLISFATQ